MKTSKIQSVNFKLVYYILIITNWNVKKVIGVIQN